MRIRAQGFRALFGFLARFLKVVMPFEFREEFLPDPDHIILGMKGDKAAAGLPDLPVFDKTVRKVFGGKFAFQSTRAARPEIVAHNASLSRLGLSGQSCSRAVPQEPEAGRVRRQA